MTIPHDPAPLGELGFDPEAVLERDSRILLDPAFLATLHAELAGELRPEEQRAALLQMGFLHGLQDVTRALASPPERGCHQTGPALAPPLRMPLRSTTDATEVPGTIRVEGTWPDHHEATAHLSAVGAGDDPVCHLSAGYTSGWLSGAFDADLVAVEVECSATGRDTCRFEAREVDDWQRDPVAGALENLAALPFETFRALVRERLARETGRELPAEAEELAGMEPGAAAVHIWGPVMVLPYAGPDETLQAIDLLARDPGAAEVTVIVLDLGGAIVDEAFGAMSLEQLVQTAEAWGAETIFVAPSAISEPVIAELEHPPLLVLKDLEPAIALAFQIARSQRRVS